MKFYELVLVGGKTIRINEDEKKIVDAYIDQEGDTSLRFGGNTIKTKTIRGIFEVGADPVAGFDKVQQEDHKEWNAECENGSRMSIEDKVNREINVRIFPGISLSGGNPSTRRMEIVASWLRVFFETFPHYPRAPLRLWWELIDMELKRKNDQVSKWWLICGRNDEAIEKWVRFEKKAEVAP